MRALGGDYRRDATEHLRVVAAGFLKLSHKVRKHVELANRAKQRRDFPETASETLGKIGLQLKDRQNLAQPSRRHARAVQGRTSPSPMPCNIRVN